MQNNSIYPWCENIWQQLLTSIQMNRFPHAILFYGNRGLGKQILALQLAQYLLCSYEHKQTMACGSCKDCILFSANTHGDFLQVSLEEHASSISIDQIRHLKLSAYQTSQRHGFKVCMIAPAEKMTIAASNALLKILEEPPGQSVFILISESKHLLSSTILSRCQHYVFHSGSLSQIQAWLAFNVSQQYTQEQIIKSLEWSFGSPLLAQQLLENDLIQEYESCAIPLIHFFAKKISLLELIKAWQGKPFAYIVTATQATCYYLLKGKWVAVFNKALVYQWLNKIIEIKKMQATGIALNEGLLQDLLLAN